MLRVEGSVEFATTSCGGPVGTEEWEVGGKESEKVNHRTKQMFPWYGYRLGIGVIGLIGKKVMPQD